MKRADRIHLVTSGSIGLFALFVAFIGVPILAAFFWPVDFSNVATAFEATTKITEMASWASIACLMVMAVCVLDVFVLLAKQFIGQSPESEKHESGCNPTHATPVK